MKSSAREGVSLIEVMVALTLFGMIATVHTVATMRYGLQARVAEIGASRAQAVQAATDLYSTMVRGSIAAATGCTPFTDDPKYPYTRCVTVSAVTATISRIMIVITPDNAALKADTLYVDRVTGNSTPPFA
jgi:prepilin-type N-terminal cleavage/methylation domain-containing protein